MLYIKSLIIRYFKQKNNLFNKINKNNTIHKNTFVILNDSKTETPSKEKISLKVFL